MNLNKKILLGVIGVLLIVCVLILVNYITDKEGDNDQTIFENIKILSVEYDKDVYYWGEKVIGIVTIQNNSNNQENLWLGYSLLDPLNNWIDIHPKNVLLSSKETVTITMEYILEDGMITGEYSAVFALWDSFPIDENSMRITDIEIDKGFRIYRKKDDFQVFDDSFWLKRDFFLGRTNLQKENVFIKDDQLHIKIPKLTLNGGEIQSKEELSFGSYEIKMKLPNAPSSITGFFLYKEPDFYHEIDIEIYNEKNTTALFTTYSDGDMQNHHSEEMSFDPTEDFNIYRIDYYPHKVSFYINGDLKVSWTEGFSLEPMRLIVNLWFPKWLEGKVPVEDKFLIIDWIRY